MLCLGEAILFFAAEERAVQCAEQTAELGDFCEQTSGGAETEAKYNPDFTEFTAEESDGQGGEELPETVEIASVADWNAFAKQCNGSADFAKDAVVTLTADISFQGEKFIPVDTFGGVFYGNGHALSDIVYQVKGARAAVFGTISVSGRVERLEVRNLTLYAAESDTVGFVGENFGTVESVTVYGSVTGATNVGGIVGYNGRCVSATDSGESVKTGTILNCKNYASVTGQVRVGGIVGYSAGEVCTAENGGNVTAKMRQSGDKLLHIGGIVGYNAGAVCDASNYGKITGEGALYVGGVCGFATGEVYYALNYGDVCAAKYVGGIVGYYGRITENLEDLQNYMGGMDFATFLRLYFTDGVRGKQSVCYAASFGQVSAYAYAGGVLGYTDESRVTLENCASVGDVSVTAGNYAGGIAGYAHGAKLCGTFSAGRISAAGFAGGNYVGGIAGSAETVLHSASVAVLQGKDYIGGIAGELSDSLCGCYTNVAIRAQSGAKNIGSLLGATDAYQRETDTVSSTVESNYYVGELGGIGGRDYGAKYAFAAHRLTGDELASQGTLSPYLVGFSEEEWMSGSTHKTFPVPRALIEWEENAAFGDDLLWQLISEKNIGTFTAIAEEYTKAEYTVVFLEWNEDNGDLYDGDSVCYDNFDVLAMVRIAAGQTAEAPELQRATYQSGEWIYTGKKGRYFVSLESQVNVHSSIFVYAQYRPVLTTLEAENVLVEGIFTAETTVSCESEGEWRYLAFYRGEEPYTAGNVTVRYRAESTQGTLYVGEEARPFTVSGSYIVFEYTGGEKFRFVPKEEGLAPWAYALIACGALVVLGAALGVVLAVRKKKRK